MTAVVAAVVEMAAVVAAVVEVAVVCYISAANIRVLFLSGVLTRTNGQRARELPPLPQDILLPQHQMGNIGDDPQTTTVD